MIEREFIKEKIRNFKIQERISSTVNRYAGIDEIIVEKTPLGERVIIFASRPGLVIGSGGETIKSLTHDLKTKFGLETPQVEVKEIRDPDGRASVVAKKIASDFERFGPKRYKATGYRALTNVIRAGARGAEIRITGVGIPGARARSWRFFAGYLKKSGDTAETVVDKAFEVAALKRGTIGIKVAIMPMGVILPDDVTIKVVEEKVSEKEVEELKEVTKIVEKPVKKTAAAPIEKKSVKKAAPKKKTPIKKVAKKVKKDEKKGTKKSK